MMCKRGINALQGTMCLCHASYHVMKVRNRFAENILAGAEPSLGELSNPPAELPSPPGDISRCSLYGLLVL